MPSFGHTTVGRNQKILYRQRCRREIEAAYSRVPKRRAPCTIEVEATNWLSLKRATFALSSFSIAESGLRLHLLPKLKKRLLSDIDAHTISRHQRQRLKEGASPKSINLEFGTLRALLRHHELWTDALRRDVRPLKVRDDHGRSLTVDEERPSDGRLSIQSVAIARPGVCGCHADGVAVFRTQNAQMEPG